jgi:hypothetical protein
VYIFLFSEYLASLCHEVVHAPARITLREFASISDSSLK